MDTFRFLDTDRLDRNLANGPEDMDQKTFRSFRNKDNNWLIERQAQRTQNFTGIVGVNTQGRAVQELQGRIAGRTKEHLGPADKAIITVLASGQSRTSRRRPSRNRHELLSRPQCRKNNAGKGFMA